jgi:hypothetical protein
MKFHGIGLCIATGDIVWVNGGVPCGFNVDLTLARKKIVRQLSIGEYALGHDGYRDPIYFLRPSLPTMRERVMSIASVMNMSTQD